MKKKIIINYEGVKYGKALALVSLVMDKGKISESNGLKQYCWLTRFLPPLGNIMVATNRKRTKNDTDSFNVWKEK